MFLSHKKYDDSVAQKVVLTVACLIIATVVVGCDDLLSVQDDPQTVLAEEGAALEPTINGATSDFFAAYDSKIVWAGLFADTFVNSGTAPGVQSWDRRDVEPDHGGGATRGSSIGGPFYTPQQRAVTVAANAQRRILEGEFDQISQPFEDSQEFALFSVFEGFSKVWLADAYCELAFGGDGPVLTTDEAYAEAAEAFTQAIDAEGAQKVIRQAALVGRARVRLILGNDSGAVEDAEQVDPAFEFFARYSTNTFAERNRVHFRTWDFSNWSVGPSFRGLTIDDTGESDPRVELAKNPSQAFDSSQDLFAPLKVESPSSPLTVASGDEAQLIIAEVEGGNRAVEIINNIRDRNGIDIKWQPSGSSENEIRNKIIEERKRTLFLEGVRLGDHRRYLEKFGIDTFQQSTPQGFEMGDQTCLPVPNIESSNNPAF